MLEYTIISILVIAWAVQTWRKRVWKKRAKAQYLGFWGMAYKQMQDAKPNPLLSHKIAKRREMLAAGVPMEQVQAEWRKHWPDVIDED